MQRKILYLNNKNQPIENLNNLDLVVVNLKQIYEIVLVVIDPIPRKKKLQIKRQLTYFRTSRVDQNFHLALDNSMES